MSSRKHISWKTKYASALLALGHIPYADAKQMTADQIISLYHVDHGILHETENKNVNQWWNLTPRLIQEHRIKTKTDAKIIAKSRRIRRRLEQSVELSREKLAADFFNRKIRSRGFDKSLRKKMSGKVERR